MSNERTPVTCNTPDCTTTIHVRERHAENLRPVYQCTDCLRRDARPVLADGGDRS